MRRVLILALLLLGAQAPVQITPGEAVAKAAGCHVINVQYYKETNTWIAHYDASCAAAQIAAGNSALAAFDKDGWLLQHEKR